MISSGAADHRLSQQSGNNQHQQLQGPNFGAATVPNGFEWACDDDFNLLDYVGNDPENIFNEETDYNNLTEEESTHKNDLIYGAMQYNELAANDYGYPRDHGYQQNGFADNQNHNYAQPSVDQSQMPTTSKGGAALMTAPMKEVKDEPDYEMCYENGSTDMLHGHTAASSTMSGSSTNTPYFDGTGEFVPTIKPRKYRLKPEQEKSNPVYRIKREKNNDAVRRSREKAKRLQQEKDERLMFLESEELKCKRLVAQLMERNKYLEKLLANCRCQSIASSSSQPSPSSAAFAASRLPFAPHRAR